jgi:hypothetical protein
MKKMVASACVTATMLSAALGCGLLQSDPVAKFINEKFPPVSLDQQRHQAISSAAGALSTLNAPNIAFGARTDDLETTLSTAPLRELGIRRVRVRGDDELLRIEGEFSHRFVDAGPDASAETKALLIRLSPEVSGEAVIYAGITSATTSNAPHETELHLKLLPVFHSIRVKSVVLEGKADVSIIGNLLEDLLNRYADNVTGELARSPIMDVVVPTGFSDTLDVSRAIRVVSRDIDAQVKIEAQPVTSPVRLLGVAWLVTDRSVSGLAQLVPVDSAIVGPTVGAPLTYPEVKRNFERLVADSFQLPQEPEGPWFAVRKDLVASIVNAAVSQAAACVSARGEAREQLSQRIAFPDETTVDCTPTRDCSPRRSCDFEPCRDTRSCNRCLVTNPSTGGCVQRGNDPACEIAKAVENERCRVEAAGRRLDCERLKAQEKATCELEKSGEKVLCEAGKEALKRLARTGKFGDVEAGVNARTENFRICMRSFALTPDLTAVRAKLDVEGNASGDVSLKFTPLDIVGHLTCQAPFTENRSFQGALRNSEVTIASDLRLAAGAGAATVQFNVQPTTFSVRLQPSPTEILLTSPNMALACHGLNLLRPLVVSLVPFIPELRGEFDYEAKQQDVAVDLILPRQKLGELTVAGTIAESRKALFVFSELGAPATSAIAAVESSRPPATRGL